MHIFPETKAPNESKVYSYDWSPRLAPGDKIDSQVVLFVDAAGTTPSDTKTDTISKVRLESGTVGGRATFAIRITTVNNEVLEEGFGVDIVDSVAGPTSPSRLVVLRQRKDEAEEALHQLSLGTRVVEIRRDGRLVRYGTANRAELQAYLDGIVNEIAELDAAAAATTSLPRRRFIGVAFG